MPDTNSSKSTFNFNKSSQSNFGDSTGKLKFSESSSDIKGLIRANGIYNRLEEDVFNKFSRYPVIDPYNALTTTKEYVFITKPDLALFKSDGNLTGSLQNIPFFLDAASRYRNSMIQLQSSADANNNPFMPLLFNTLTSTLDIPGISAETVETAANIMGTKINYRGTSHKSDEEHDFNLEFEDNKYLDVYMLFKIYDEYEKFKWNGKIDFGADACGTERWQNYIVNKVLHDQFSIYKFIVADDGMRIIYWAKLTGVFPTSIPRDSFSDMTDSNPTKITVGFKSHFVRDMDPIIIKQFNTLATGMGGWSGARNVPLYNTGTHSIEGKWVRFPYIEPRAVSDKYRGNYTEYFLRWATT